MNTIGLVRFLLPLALAVPGLAAPGKNCGCDCCKDRPKGVACCCNETEAAATTATRPADAKSADDGIKRYPLKGVVTGVMADRSALLVKHEEIPGFMRAMTMLFKVDAATLKAAQKGQAITGLMSRQGSDWVLEDVKLAAANKH